jgi:ligand-binding sensor domain-containing protein
MQILKISLLVFVLLLINNEVIAQTNNWYIYDQSNTGLPTDEVISVTTDDNGNIWLATKPDHDINYRGGGVVSYDGHKWTWYNTDNSGLTSLNTEYITVDRNNELWGAYSGGHVFHYDGITWEDFYHPTDSIYFYGKTLIIVDSNNTKWFASEGLSSYNDDVWTYHSSNLIILDGIAQDKNGNFWVYSQISNSIGVFDGSSWTYFTPENSNFPDLPITSIEVDNNNLKYFGTDNEGIIKYDDTTWIVLDPIVNNQTIHKVISLKIDTNNILWICADNNLFKFDGNEFSIVDLTQFYIYTNDLISLYIDKNDNKYLSFYDDGFAQQKGIDWEKFTTGNTGISVRPFKVQKDNSNNLWLGTWGFGLVQYKNNEWNVFNKRNSILPSDAVGYLYKDKYNNIWVNTPLDSGYIKINDDQWTRITLENSGLPSPHCGNIVMDIDNNYWIGSLDSGLIKYDGSNWTTYNLVNGRFPTNSVEIIKPDAYGNVWISNYNTLIKFDGTNWTEYNYQNSGLPDSHIKDIYVNSLDNLFIGTYSAGLIWTNLLNWEIYNSQNSPLPDNWIHCLNKDQLNNLWIGTDAGGVSKFDGQNWEIINSSNSQLPSNNVLDIFIDEGNNKWITTEENLSVYNETGINEVKDKGLNLVNYNLLQNYPNPFNPSTTITYQIPELSFVTLKIYDVLGNEITTLVNEEKAIGSYEKEFDGTALPSGIYFYQLKAGDFIQTKKMILLK